MIYRIFMYMCLTMCIILYKSGQAHYHSCINDLHTELSDVYCTIPCAPPTPSMYYTWRLTSASLAVSSCRQLGRVALPSVPSPHSVSATRYFHCSDHAIRESHVTTNDYPTFWRYLTMAISFSLYVQCAGNIILGCCSCAEWRRYNMGLR